jgi:benzil reductase ((S)-benzoin forming)
MNYYFITGTGRGIGAALARELLSEEGNFVTGISRECTISSENFRFVSLDLNDLEKVSDFTFPELADADSVSLINNAGVLGEVKYMGENDNRSLIRTFNVNTIAPALLMNSFMKMYSGYDIPKTILAISSGAGRYPVDGWGGYCSSKSAIDMITRVTALEQEIKPSGFRVFAVAPGVVETAMQDKIRTVNPEDFSRVQDFIDYKNKGELLQPQTVASKLISVLFKEKRNIDAVFSLRDV